MQINEFYVTKHFLFFFPMSTKSRDMLATALVTSPWFTPPAS